MKSRNDSNDALQEKLRAKSSNPVDEAMKTIMKSQSRCCVRAKVKLEELEKNEEK